VDTYPVPPSTMTHVDALDKMAVADVSARSERRYFERE
jgi:hypothetical protein